MIWTERGPRFKSFRKTTGLSRDQERADFSEVLTTTSEPTRIYRVERPTFTREIERYNREEREARAQYQATGEPQRVRLYDYERLTLKCESLAPRGICTLSDFVCRGATNNRVVDGVHLSPDEFRWDIPVSINGGVHPRPLRIDWIDESGNSQLYMLTSQEKRGRKLFRLEVARADPETHVAKPLTGRPASEFNFA